MGYVKPQGTLKGMWVKEVGESECSLVMKEIRVEAEQLTLPGLKKSRLPTGVYLRENLKNLFFFYGASE